MIDYQALHDEIINDPLTLGYLPLVEFGNDKGIVDLLNTITEETVTEPRLSRTDFLAAILPVMLVLPSLSVELQNKWDRVLAMIHAAEYVTISGADVQGLFFIAIQDGVLTPEQIAAIGKKPASRAEVLFGIGTSVTDSDVSFALRGIK